MKLNPYSIPNRLHFWFYGVENFETIKNGCPWFWKSVLMWLLIIPYVVFCIPVIAYEIYTKKYANNGANSVYARVGISIGVYLALVVILAALLSVSLIFVTYEKKTFLDALAHCGFLIWLVVFVFGAMEGIKYLKERHQEKKRAIRYDKMIKGEDPNQGSAVYEMISALYHKYCPKIEWQIKKEE